MPSLERVKEFITFVEQGRFVEALQEFYTEDATMQENLDPPRIGRGTLIEHEQRMMARFKEIAAFHVGAIFMQGDQVIINWVFQFTDATGHCVGLDEISFQVWRGDRIARERFYYDPKQLQA